MSATNIQTVNMINACLSVREIQIANRIHVYFKSVCKEVSDSKFDEYMCLYISSDTGASTR